MSEKEGRTQSPVEVYGVEKILDEGIKSRDNNAISILKAILLKLTKIEIYLSEMSDISLNDEDVEILGGINIEEE